MGENVIEIQPQLMLFKLIDVGCGDWFFVADMKSYFFKNDNLK